MSPRPKRNRTISKPPFISGFEPLGNQGNNGFIELHYEEYESVKLTDYENYTHDQAAVNMNISRPTFTRIYEMARKKIAKAFVESKTILITGGKIAYTDNWFECNTCTVVFKKPVYEKVSGCVVCFSNDIRFINENPGELPGLKEHRGGFTETDVDCICPKCRKRIPHQAGIPCRTLICPDCGVSMLREQSATYRNIQQLTSQRKEKIEFKEVNVNKNQKSMQIKKIAIPVEGGQMCAHFGHCEHFAIFSIEDGKIVKEELLVPPVHQPGVYPAWLGGIGVTDIIAGGIGQRVIDLFNNQHVNVYAGASLTEPVELVNNLLNGTLVAGQNLCDH